MCSKWLTYGNNGLLEVHDVRHVFRRASRTRCNLVAVFGKAREGKSFLMNCLAHSNASISNTEDCFPVSAAHLPCTTGVDLCNQLIPLETLTSNALREDEKDIVVGFVDIEGQGDKDVAYDANLICPILLTSKCVIFNWKGDLQKDHILSTLGIMARAAQNITTDTHSTEVFNHLHIVFRDWQAASSSALEVRNYLFTLEGEGDGAGYDLRNRLRVQILQAFASVSVWLFDLPTERTVDLKQKLTFDKTSAAFRAQVRALREALAKQLKEPTFVAGHALTGRAFGPLTEQIAAVLNAGGVVLPSSAYLGMVQQELQSTLRAYQAALEEGVSNMAVLAGELFPEEGCEWVDEQDCAMGDMFASLAQSVAGNLRHLPGFAEPVTPAPPGSAVDNALEAFSTQRTALEAVQRQSLQQACAASYDAWLRRYNQRKQAALDTAVAEASEVAASLFSAAVADPLSADGLRGAAFEEAAPELTAQVVGAVASSVGDWLLHRQEALSGAVKSLNGVHSLGDSAEAAKRSVGLRAQLQMEVAFLNDLSAAVRAVAEEYRPLWASHHIADGAPQKTTAASSAPAPAHDQVTSGAESVSEDRPCVDQPARDDRRRSSLGGMLSRLAVSVTEQRRRAQDWARRQLGMTFDGEGSAGRQSEPASTVADKPTRPVKSFAEQRRDALRHAMATYGWRTVQDIPADSDSEAEELGQGKSSEHQQHRAPTPRLPDDRPEFTTTSRSASGSSAAMEEDGYLVLGTATIPVPAAPAASSGPVPMSMPAARPVPIGSGAATPLPAPPRTSDAGRSTVRDCTVAPTRSPDADRSPAPPLPPAPLLGGGVSTEQSGRSTAAWVNPPPAPSGETAELQGFYRRCIADLYCATSSCTPEVAARCLSKDYPSAPTGAGTDVAVTQQARELLRGFEERLCKVADIKNRRLCTVVTDAHCTFHCEVDFNGAADTDISGGGASRSPRTSDVSSVTLSTGVSAGTADSAFGGFPDEEVLGAGGSKTGTASGRRLYTVQLMPPTVTRIQCIFYHLFPRHRFLKARLTPLASQKGDLRARARRALDEGLRFAGRRYHFIVGAGTDKGEANGYWFATHDDTGLLPPISVQTVRNALANFEPDSGGVGKLALPGKINARLMLGFSPTHGCLQLVDKQVLVVDDVQREGGMVMSDGCGFISAALLTSMPFAIHGGIPFCPRRLPRHRDRQTGGTNSRAGSDEPLLSGPFVEAPLPNTIQVRLSCRKGLFKGCLIVTTDDALCPAGCVVMRQSMLKVPGATHIQPDTPCTLFVNKTFEKVNSLPHTAYRNLTGLAPSMAGSSNPWGASLSVDLALLLCHLGLPQQYVLGLAQREIENIECIGSQRSVAVEVVHRQLRRADRRDAPLSDAGSGDSIDGDFATLPPFAADASMQRPDDQGSDSEEAGNCLSASSSAYSVGDSPALKAFHFLFAGHPLSEPQLQKHLNTLQGLALKKLRKLKFQLPQSAYLVGVPDPYGVLAEQEVYVYVPLTEGEVRTSATISGCEVLVTRHPMHHPGDIRKLRAVTHPVLDALFGGSSSPVIVFSTLGQRSQADMMGGGDFDGDEYCVIYNQTIVRAVRTVAPYCASDYPPCSTVKTRPPDPDAHLQRDALGVDLLATALHFANCSIVGLCSKAWWVHADRDPSSREARLCDHYARQALDAAKSGFDASSVRLPPILAKPHYMREDFPQVRSVYQSGSIVGAVMDAIERRVGELRTTSSAAPTADPDVCTVVEGGVVVFNMRQEVQYHLQRQQAGQELRWELWDQWKGLFERYRSGVGSIVSGGADIAEERLQMRTMREQFIAAFDRDAAQLPRQDARFSHLSSYTARRVLAALVYYLTYENSPCYEGVYRVGFCWEVCAAELHDNKRRSVARRMGQHEHDLLPAGFLRDMYNIELSFGTY